MSQDSFSNHMSCDLDHPLFSFSSMCVANIGTGVDDPAGECYQDNVTPVHSNHNGYGSSVNINYNAYADTPPINHHQYYPHSNDMIPQSLSYDNMHQPTNNDTIPNSIDQQQYHQYSSSK